MNSQEYLNEMLHLTADIAEELITLKDTGLELGDETTEKIARLAELAINCRTETPVSKSSTLPEIQTGEEPVPEPEAAIQIEKIEKTGIEELPEPTEDNAFQPAVPMQEDTLNISENSGSEELSTIQDDIVSEDESSPVSDNRDEQIAESSLMEEKALADDGPDTIPAAPRQSHFSARELRNAFTLNDVFLFQRTLFHGSSAEFRRALEEITSFTNTTELEEYLATEHGVDLTTPEAEDFINIVKTFF